MIEGPFLKIRNTSKSFDTQYLYKSVPRANRPLPYYRTIGSASAPWALSGLSNALSSAQVSRMQIRTYAKAYDAWHRKANAKAQMALNALELKSSMAMIAKRAQQLYHAARAIRKLRFGDAFDALDVSRSQRKRMKAKYPADAWLELTFGWKPLIQDIGTAVEVLQRDFPSERIRSMAFDVEDIKYPWDGGSSTFGVVKVHYALGGRMVVTNPNLLLANQLGFVNPVAVAWDWVPFSFVVDWFLPVNKFLNSFSNDFGFEVAEPSVAWSAVCGLEQKFEYADPKDGYSRGFRFDRRLTPFWRPGLFDRVQLPKLDTWLAATSISLLMQQFSRIRSAS